MESHTGGDGASSPPTGLLGQMSDMLPDPASPRDSSSPISPSLDTKTSVSDLGRTVSRTSLDQGKLVSLGNTDYHDLSPTQDCLPRIEVSPPRSPDPLADDSCHPSPELPHRTVCVAPDPDISDTEDIIPTNSLKVMGGNLGGMANQAFNPDDYRDEEGSDTATLSADDVQELDGAYGRNRNLQEVLDTVIPLSPVLDNTDTIPGTATVSSVLQTSVTLPLMLFLHGVGGSADIWRAQLSHFSLLGYTCLAPDMLGHGFSACPDSAKAYTFSRLFKDVLAIFDAFVSEDKRAVVFGHSYGCSFSVALARARPERVCTLVLVAGGGPTPLAPPPDKAPRPVMHCLLTLLRRVLECKPGSSQQKYNPRGKTLKFKPAYDVPSYVLNHMMAGQVWSEGDAGFHRRVTVPSLLVYGMRDCLVSLVEECEMERTLPKAFLELVPGAGHAVMLDTPAQFNTMTERFVKKWTGGMH